MTDRARPKFSAKPLESATEMKKVTSPAVGPVSHFRRLGSDTSGLAMVEFALSMPLLIPLCFVGIQTADYTLANMRLSQISSMVADNAGRVRRAIDETDIDEVMIAARLAGASLKLGERGRIILSSVEPNGQSGGNAGQKITWQRCFGKKNVPSSFGVEGAGATNSALAQGIGPTGQRILAPTASAVLYVELQYDYQPIVPEFLFPSRTITYRSAYSKREGLPTYPTNLASLVAPQRRLCSVLSAT